MQEKLAKERHFKKTESIQITQFSHKNQKLVGNNLPLKDILKHDRNMILEGVQQSVFVGSQIAVSSFLYPKTNCISILEDKNRHYCVAGRISKGKIFMFGHTDIYYEGFVQDDSQRRLLQNVIQWMCGSREKILIGLLFSDGQWPQQLSLQSLGLDIQIKFVDQVQDLEGLDIICVTYYGSYPKAMTPKFNQKVKKIVENGGNLIFASHGWVWQGYGQRKDNSSLVFQKDFGSYVLLKIFGIVLNSNYFNITNSFKPILQLENKVNPNQNFVKVQFLKSKKIQNSDSKPEKVQSEPVNRPKDKRWGQLLFDHMSQP